LLCSAVISFAQDTASQQSFEEKVRLLELTISSDETVYELGEAILVTLTLKNNGLDNVKPYYVMTDSFIVSNGKEVAVSGWLTWRGSTEGELPLGSEFSHSLNITRMFAVEKAGDYSIFWRYKERASNTIAVEVVEGKQP